MSNELKKPKNQYEHLGDAFSKYWSCYGGLKDFISSPYLSIAIIISLLMFPIWGNVGWWDLVINILPSILGFSLGGYAIFTAFGDEKFKYAISGQDDDDFSPFIRANASFLHFIVVQLFALFIALIMKAQLFSSLPFFIQKNIQDLLTVCEFETLPIFIHLLWFIGFSFFIYSLSLALAATFAIFRMAIWFDNSVTFQKSMEEKLDEDPIEQ